MVRRLFPKAEVSAVMVILDRYSADLAQPERALMQPGHSELERGSDIKVGSTARSQREYRDVLHSVEKPAQLPAVLEVLRTKWSWALLSEATRVVAQNRFGNVLVELSDGSIWRVCPEDATAARVAESEAAIAELWADQEFQTDWTGDAWIEVAEPALGPLEEGQCYGFRVWPVLGGAYEVENMVIKSMLEWLAVSGDVGRQIKDLPSGAQIRLDVRDA